VTETVLFFAHYAVLLLFGITLSFAFCGLRFTKKNCLILFALFLFCAALQITVYTTLGEAKTWQLYPVIVHVPLGILLGAVFRKRPVSVLASVSLSYLCCQPSKWIGILADILTHNNVVVLSVRIVTLLLGGFLLAYFLAPYIYKIFSNKDNKTTFVIGCIPLTYYLFDYATMVYSDLWYTNHRVVGEFLSFLLCASFITFCILYYKEYEKKADAERKERIVEITAQQQIKEIDAIRKSDLETRLLRHDMRLLLSNLALSVEQDDKETALKLISGYTEQVEKVSLRRYCGNDTINYILQNYESRCRDLGIRFNADVQIGEFTLDEVLFSSILSNALDNAINAQAALPEEQRTVTLMLKDSGGKLLLSVKNPYKDRPVFIDGLPVASKQGHGYGTQSIRYMTERLGGKCRFVLQDNTFVLQIVL